MEDVARKLYEDWVDTCATQDCKKDWVHLTNDEKRSWYNKAQFLEDDGS